MPPTTASTLPLDREPDDAGSPAGGESDRAEAALGVAGAAWGIAGQLALLLVAALQLSRAALRGFAAGAGAWGLAAGAVSVAALCYLQGYRGFQRRYAPLVAARAAHLARHPRPWHAALAPAYVCGLVHATRRRRRSTALLFAVMPLLAIAVARLPEPFRAALDLGVAAGLLWGALAVATCAARAARGRPPAVALDLPSRDVR